MEIMLYIFDQVKLAECLCQSCQSLVVAKWQSLVYRNLHKDFIQAIAWAYQMVDVILLDQMKEHVCVCIVPPWIEDSAFKLMKKAFQKSTKEMWHKRVKRLCMYVYPCMRREYRDELYSAYVLFRLRMYLSFGRSFEFSSMYKIYQKLYAKKEETWTKSST